jgi:hypothetical protein
MPALVALKAALTAPALGPEEHGPREWELIMTVVCDTRITTKEFVARVPAVYLKSAEGTI